LRRDVKTARTATNQNQSGRCAPPAWIRSTQKAAWWRLAIIRMLADERRWRYHASPRAALFCSVTVPSHSVNASVGMAGLFLFNRALSCTPCGSRCAGGGVRYFCLVRRGCGTPTQDIKNISSCACSHLLTWFGKLLVVRLSARLAARGRQRRRGGGGGDGTAWRRRSATSVPLLTDLHLLLSTASFRLRHGGAALASAAGRNRASMAAVKRAFNVAATRRMEGSLLRLPT